MPSYVFSIVIDHRPTDIELEKFSGSGVGDAMFGTERGVPVVEFDREAPSLPVAIVSAIRDLVSAGLTPLRVVDEDLLTLADIADRVGQSRESIRRYATGERGPGGFPAPVNPARDGTVFYRWSEVAPWLRESLGSSVADDNPTLVMANLLLQVRHLAERVEDAPTLFDLLQRTQ